MGKKNNHDRFERRVLEQYFKSLELPPLLNDIDLDSFDKLARYYQDYGSKIPAYIFRQLGITINLSNNTGSAFDIPNDSCISIENPEGSYNLKKIFSDYNMLRDRLL